MEKIKSALKSLCPAITVTVILMIICGLVYPLALNGLSAVIFPHQAKGSLIEVDGKAVGSLFVGQDFTEDYFMKCRPSAVSYNTYTETEDGKKMLSNGNEFSGVASGSANYGPSNPALKERVENDLEEFLKANPDIKKEDIPTDLLTASGSGLDPHISPEAARVQLPKISEASSLSMETLEKIVEDNTEGKLFGIFGEDKVNVLKVNIDIMEAMGISR